jgi:hypothetical protein
MRFDLNEFNDAIKATVRYNNLVEKKCIIELIEVKPKRTIKANSYLHKLFELFGIHFGLTAAESKTELKRQCPFMRYEKKGKVFLRHTSKMDTNELSEFIDWIRTFSSLHGCYLPTSEEYITNQISIDKTISQHKEFL